MGAQTFEDAKIQIGTEIDCLRLLLKNEEFAATYSDHISPSLFREQLKPIAEIALKYWKQYRKLVNNTALVQELHFKVGTGFSKEKLDGCLNVLYQLSADPVAPKYTEDTVANFIRFQRMDNALAEAVQVMNTAEKNRDMTKLDEVPNMVVRAAERLQIAKPQYFLADLEKRTEARTAIASGEVDRLAFGTGIPSLDELRMPTKGLLLGEIGIWMAATGRGKSIALTHCAMTAALRGFPVAYFSLELPEEMLLDRADSMASRTAISDIVNERLAVQQYIQDMRENSMMGDIAFKELPCTGVTVSQLRNELIRMQQMDNFEPKLICVDYMDLMLPSVHKKEGGWKEQQTVIQELRALGGEVGAAVWTASQGNRGSAQKNDEGSLMSDADAAESYLKLGVADWVVTINRTKKQMEMPQPQPAWLFVPKNRTGIANRKVGILTDFSIMSFYEGDYEENPMEQLEEDALQSGAFEGKKKKKLHD